MDFTDSMDKHIDLCCINKTPRGVVKMAMMSMMDSLLDKHYGKEEEE